jgi:hypothetical protein
MGKSMRIVSRRSGSICQNTKGPERSASMGIEKNWLKLWIIFARIICWFSLSMRIWPNKNRRKTSLKLVISQNKETGHWLIDSPRK